MTRAEVAAMSDVGLALAYDRLASRISEDWRRGAPGMLSHVFALALIRFEADIRSMSLTPVNLHGQPSITGFPEIDVNGDLLLASI